MIAWCRKILSLWILFALLLGMIEYRYGIRWKHLRPFGSPILMLGQQQWQLLDVQWQPDGLFMDLAWQYAPNTPSLPLPKIQLSRQAPHLHMRWQGIELSLTLWPSWQLAINGHRFDMPQTLMAKTKSTSKLSNLHFEDLTVEEITWQQHPESVLDMKNVRYLDFELLKDLRLSWTKDRFQIQGHSRWGRLNTLIEHGKILNQDDADFHVLKHADNWCLQNQEHRLCLSPEGLLKAQGPFQTSLGFIKNLLTDIKLAGTYHFSWDIRKPQALTLDLRKLRGELNHLAPGFWMDLRYLITQGQLHITGEGQHFQGQGEWLSPQGKVKIDATWRDQALRLQLRSPHLRFQEGSNQLAGDVDLTLSWSESIRLQGRVGIHEGQLGMDAILSTELLHEDVLLPGNPQLPRYELDLDVAFKKRIPFKSLGLQGQLGGAFHLHNSSNFGQRVRGSLDLQPAIFRVFGRELMFNDCRIFWSDAAWEEGKLRMSAHRHMSNELSRSAQIQMDIYGPIEHPEVFISSHPQGLSELQIISYLFSRSGRSNPQEDAELITSLEAIPGQKGLLRLLAMIDRIERGLGLDLFEVGIDRSLESSVPQQFTLGKMLHPKLLVKYTLNFDREEHNHLTLRYALRPHLSLEVATNQQDTGLYLLYER